MAPIRVLVVGAGSRGSAYAAWIREHPGIARVVAVAEPRPAYRDRLADACGVPHEARFSDWREAAALPRTADAALVCTLDDAHLEPALAFAASGHHLMVEKPLAQTPADCTAIVEAAQRAGVLLSVGHVLRHAPYTRLVTSLLEAGRIGRVTGIDHIEPVGFWHHAHSYVRGNWRRAADAAPMLLAKSCHDLDWIRYVVGREPTAVSSFGSLRHFRPEEAPEGAAERCTECPVEPECAYSAPRIYGRFLEKGGTGWPLDVLTPEPTAESVAEALRTGPYGRCVYHCDNDVVDRQVVALEFAGGATGTFTMTAFTQAGHRRTTLFGTDGELYCDGDTVTVYDFLTRTTETLKPESAEGAGAGHGGGDGGLLSAFFAGIAADDPELVETSGEDALRSHLLVFAAERARTEGRVVALPERGTGRER
ncbi:Gfo/Idh/MocA family protein [Nocardiopsis chromatogenes]|uniref:Gfo/Idh/MocA family protein n=1 Tax=Nocardiopsis chromatogenes TaxID=280239 RepID=UPI00034AD371|nr:Gfo/Idh/MocA family oxidoreductase [Nocardiopsis chromatogenes]